jgi:hypothetical protein
MVAREATEQIMYLHCMLYIMGIPVDDPSLMFGDNQCVIFLSTIPQSDLNKHHNAFSYHRVRETIAAGLPYFIHIDGKLNQSDILTMVSAWAKVWPLIQPMLFWTGYSTKHIHHNLPIIQIIEAMNLAASSGL